MRTYLALSAAMLLLCACNTVEGFGKDMEKGGQVLRKTAE